MSEKYYYDRRQYVDTVLNNALMPMTDFGEIRYARSAVTEKEFVKIADLIGGCAFLDVTAEPLEKILKDVSKIVLNSELGAKFMPSNILVSAEEKRAAAALFR